MGVKEHFLPVQLRTPIPAISAGSTQTQRAVAASRGSTETFPSQNSSLLHGHGQFQWQTDRNRKVDPENSLQ